MTSNQKMYFLKCTWMGNCLGIGGALIFKAFCPPPPICINRYLSLSPSPIYLFIYLSLPRPLFHSLSLKQKSMLACFGRLTLFQRPKFLCEKRHSQLLITSQRRLGATHITRRPTYPSVFFGRV